MEYINEIAKRISEGGKVKIGESRRLAKAYVNQSETVARLEKKIRDLQGGDVVEFRRHQDFQENQYRVHSWSAADKHIESRIENSKLNDLLTFNIQVDSYHVSGPEQHVSRFLQINGLINLLLQMAYNEGFSDGKSILRGLATGTHSISEFTAQEERTKT